MGVTTAKAGPSVMLYPNPARDRIWLDWSNPLNVPVSIQLSNLRGEPVFQLQKTANVLHEAIPVADLPAGTYILRFTGDGRMSQQLIQVVH